MNILSLLLRHKRPAESSSLQVFLQQYEYVTENQGGDWLAIEIENARQLARAGLYTDVLTAIFQKPVELPLEQLINRRELHARDIPESKRNHYIKQLSQAMQQQRWQWHEHLLPFINVEYDAEVVINRNQAIIYAAQQAGLQHCPCRVAYYAGAELRQGDLSPAHIHAMMTTVH